MATAETKRNAKPPVQYGDPADALIARDSWSGRDYSPGMVEPLWAMSPLRRRRLEQGWAQWLLARKSGVSVGKISFAERGVDLLTAAERERLATALDCDEGELFVNEIVQ